MWSPLSSLFSATAFLTTPVERAADPSGDVQVPVGMASLSVIPCVCCVSERGESSRKKMKAIVVLHVAHGQRSGGRFGGWRGLRQTCQKRR